MKLSHKIFIISYLLIMLSMYLIGFLMISNNYKNNLNKEININISSHNTLRKILLEYLNIKEVTDPSINMDTLIENNKETNNTISSLVDEFNKNYNNNKYVQVYKNSSIIYSNIINNPTNLNNMIDINYITTYITEYEGDTVLFVSSKIEINNTTYDIITGNSIIEIYNKREAEISFFIKVSLLLSIIVSIFLFIFVYFISRRINKLSKAISEVTSGSYNISVKENGKDEIAVLSHGFNNMTQAINNNLEKVNQLSESRKEFIADITHEIRTPLTSIIGYSDLLRKVKINDKNMILEYSDRIYNEGEHIKDLSEKLMSIVLLENDKIELNSINISEVIEEALESSEYIVNKNIKFTKNIIPNIYINGDRDLIKSVVINLVRNSNFACEGKNSEIIVNLYEDRFEVIDNGKGICKSQIDKILEPFYTIDKSRNRNKNGLGLGLYLCKKIIDIHHFYIDIKSEENVGTKITIYFRRNEV